MFLKSNLPYFFSWKQPELRLYVAKTCSQIMAQNKKLTKLYVPFL